METWAEMKKVPDASDMVCANCLELLYLLVLHPFFSRPSPKAGRELQTTLDTRIMEGGMMDPWRKIISRSRSPGRESTQRLCTCFCLALKSFVRFWNPYFNVYQGLAEAFSPEVSLLVNNIEYAWRLGIFHASGRKFKTSQKYPPLKGAGGSSEWKEEVTWVGVAPSLQ